MVLWWPVNRITCVPLRDVKTFMISFQLSASAETVIRPTSPQKLSVSVGGGGTGVGPGLPAARTPAEVSERAIAESRTTIGARLDHPIAISLCGRSGCASLAPYTLSRSNSKAG